MNCLPWPKLAALALAAPLLAGCPMRPGAAEQQPPAEGDTSTGIHLPSAPSQAIRQDPQADQALMALRATAGQMTKKQAVQAFTALWRTYPATTSGEQALYEAATLSYDLGDFGTARKQLNQLLFENPLFEKANEAKEKLGLAALQTHAYRDAYQTLSSLADRATGTDRQRLLQEAGQAAEGGQLWSAALQIALTFAGQAQTPDEQKSSLDRVTYLIESKVPFIDIARAQQDLSTNNPAWPILTFKLGRIYFHLRDWTHLEDTLQSFLAHAPNSPSAPEAQQMLARANQTGKTNPRVIGVVLPLTGDYKLVGQMFLRGIQLAFRNSSVQLVVKDSMGDPNLASQAVEQLAVDDGAIAILGPLAPEESKRAAITADELGVPLLTMTAAEHITDLGPYVFRNMLTWSDQSRAMADFATKRLGFKSFALLYPSTRFGKDFANVFWTDVLDDGGQIRGAESYASDQTTFTFEAKDLVGKTREDLEDRKDFVDQQKAIAESELDAFHKRKALEKLEKGVDPTIDFDAIFIPDDWQRVGLLAPALAVEDIVTNACDQRELERLKKTTGKEDIKSVTLLGISAWSSPKNADGVPKLIERGGKFVLCSIYVDGFFLDSGRPSVRRFVKAYEDTYKDQPEPGLFESTAFDSGKIFRYIADQKQAQTRDAFREALASLRNFEGSTGKVFFNDQREAQRPLFFLTIDPNGIREVGNEKLTGS